MAIDISGLTLLEQRSPEIIGKLLNKETVLRLFVPHEGYNPGPALLRLYEGGGDLENCCTIPDSGGEFSEVPANVVCIMSGGDFCEENLAKYLNDLKFRFTAGNESIDSTLEQLLMEQELAKVSLHIDRLVWQGDTTSSNGNLNKIDGLIKQALNNPLSVKPTITADNLYAAIIQIITALPPEAYDMGGEIGIFMSRSMAQQLKLTLIGMNLYHFNPGTVSNPDNDYSMPLFDGIRIIPTRGLDNTNYIIATPRNNIHWLTNLANDHMTLDWGYDKYHQVYYWRIKFLLGLTFGLFENVVIAQVDEDIIGAAYCPCSSTGGGTGEALDVNVLNTSIPVSDTVTVTNDGTFVGPTEAAGATQPLAAGAAIQIGNDELLQQIALLSQEVEKLKTTREESTSHPDEVKAKTSTKTKKKADAPHPDEVKADSKESDEPSKTE